jgi:ABC-type multidrug transport system fused ATPase/permease subunit
MTGRIFNIIDTIPDIPLKGGKWPYLLHGEVSSSGSSNPILSAEPTTRTNEGRVVFDNVRFTYPMRRDVEVLQGFDLVVEPNQTVALVGASGSGKSTTLCACWSDSMTWKRALVAGKHPHSRIVSRQT